MINTRPSEHRLKATGRRAVECSGLTYPSLIVLAIWALLMIALPIVRALASTQIFNALVVISVAVQAVAVLMILGEHWGRRRTLWTALAAAILSWVMEAVGSTTGYPFGQYDYTNSLRPQLLGVPLVIPLAWLMMLPPAWAVAQAIVGRVPRWLFVIASAAAFTAWDLFLDPQMVSWGYWIWESPSGYFGIPWINFAGWFVVSAMLTFVLRPLSVPVLPLLIIYSVTWALESIGLIFFFGLTGPGMVGLAVMGLFVVVAWRRVLRRSGESTSGLVRENHV